MRRFLITLPAVGAICCALGGCGLIPLPPTFDAAWDACIESFERQPMHHWENSEIAETVPASQSCNAYVEDLGRDEFTLSFTIPEWVAIKEDTRRGMDMYHDSQLSD